MLLIVKENGKTLIKREVDKRKGFEREMVAISVAFKVFMVVADGRA